MGQTLLARTLWNILLTYKFRRRGVTVLESAGEVSWDIVVEPPVKLGNVTVGNYVTIGKHSYVVSGTLCENVSIGRYCSIGSNVYIAELEHPIHYLTTSPFSINDSYIKKMYSKKTKLGNDVWVGANVFIRRGITISDGAVVGAGAVVLNDVPAYSIVAGVPARIIKYRFNEETIKKLLELKWWEIDETLLKSLDFSNIEECIKALELMRKH